MSIFVVENIILNIILVLFPILIYFVISCYREDTNKCYENMLLSIALITSLYLCLRFGDISNNSKMLLFCNIPIVIAYMKKRPSIAIILSVVNILYCIIIYDALYTSTIAKYASYFILYLCANKKRLSSGSFILSIAVLQGFFLSFEYFFREITISFDSFIELIILVFTYYIVTFSVLYIFKLIDRIKYQNSSIKSLEKDKMIKDALFKLTHEIKNPLAVCKGYLDMLDLDKKDKAIKYVSIMKQEINRSLNIMTDFLQFNKIKIVKEEIDLNLLLEDVYDCFKIIVKSKNIKLEYYDKEDEEITFNGDYERLKQVLINLLKNSLEAVEENGKIKIYSRIGKNYLDMIIEDNGIGMSIEQLEKIKEMFYTTKIGGSGLGVALSNEIIKAHDGDLIYDSMQNKGTKVTIRLPY